MRYISLLLILAFGSLSLTAGAASATEGSTSLSKDTLFNILAAEFAIYRDQYQQAQNFYLAEARKQKSANLAERATRLALHNEHYIDMLEAALIWRKADSENPDAVFFTALAYAYNGQANLALDTMQQVLRSKQTTDFTQLVNLMPASSHSESFYIQSLKQAWHEQPKNSDLNLALALLYSRTHNTEKALFHTDKAVEQAKENTQIFDFAVRIYLKHQQTQKALDIYRNAIKQHPDNIRLREALVHLASQHDTDEARKQLSELIELSPNNSEYLLNYALLSMEQEQFTDAERSLKHMLTLNKQNDTAHYYLGLAYFYQQQHTQALAQFSSVISGSERLLAQEYMVRLYADQALYSEAISRLNQLLAKTENDQQLRLYLLKARILDSQGHSDQAHQLLNTLLDDAPDNIDLRYQRAMITESLGKLDAMEADLRHILQLDPNNAMALNALGYTLANRTDRHIEALQLIEQANQLLPDNPAILDSLGWALYRLGKLEDSLHYLEKAWKLYPDAEVAAHLGEVLWAVGQKKEAEKVWQEALNSSPDNAVLNETIQRFNDA